MFFWSDMIFDSLNPLTEDGKGHKKSNLAEVGLASEKMMGVIPSANKPVKATENVDSDLELKDPSLKGKSNPTNLPLQSVPNESWMQVC